MHDPEGPDTERDDDSEGAIQSVERQSRSVVNPDTAAPASEADAEDEVAAAEARVEAARARLSRLRRVAETGDADGEDVPEDDAAAEDSERSFNKTIRARMRWPRRSPPSWKLRRPGRRAVAIGVGGVLVATSLAASAYMLQQHHVIEHKRRLSQEYAAAARQGVTTLMSIDTNHAKDDIQRIIDASTGPLRSQLSVMSQLMLQQAQESKTITKVSVEAVAVESPSDNSAVALVMAKTDVTEAENDKRPPQLWRLSVEIVREGGQFKMSKVEFLQ